MWRSEELEQVTQGKGRGDAFAAASVVIDSRKITPGVLFVALKGVRVDGHEYVKEALAAGAAGAIVNRIPSGLPKNAPLIEVADTYKALVDIAVASRGRTAAKIIAVTGSVGKTGAKEAIRIALAGAGEVSATQGNLNNHIGLPLSLANLPPSAKFGVFELGMNHAGEISFLTRISRPQIAVITNVEAVHLEFFASVEAIADAKAEIMEGMDAQGTLILNRDNRHFERLAAKAAERGIANVVTFGEHEESHCRLVHYAAKETGSRVEAVIHGMPVAYDLGTLGRHWAFTSLAALAVCVAAGRDLADAAAALVHFHEPDGRGRLRQIQAQDGYAILIDDSYNASPSSIAAAIVKLAEIKAARGGKGRTLVALGDMLELGDASVDLHKSLVEPLMQQGIDKAYLAGPLMRHLYDVLPLEMRAAHAPSAVALAATLAAEVRPDDVVLIKGSRGSRMDLVRDALISAVPNRSKESADAL